MEDRTLCVQYAERLGKIQDGISDIKVSLAIQSETMKNQQSILDEHVKRSNLSEKRLDKLEIPYLIIAYVIPVLASLISILRYMGKI